MRPLPEPGCRGTCCRAAAEAIDDADTVTDEEETSLAVWMATVSGVAK